MSHRPALDAAEQRHPAATHDRERFFHEQRRLVLAEALVPHQAQVPWRRGAWLASLLLLAATLLVLTYQLMDQGAVGLAVGPGDRRFVLDTHEVELFAGTPVRWTTGASMLQLPPPAAHTPLLLSLTLLNSRPAEYADPTLALTVQGQPYAQFPIIRKLNGKRHYALLLPPQDPAGWQVRLGLNSDTIRPAGDPRDLGFVLLGASLQPTATRPMVPPTWQLASWLLLAACGYGALRGLGLRASLAWGTMTLALLLLAWGQSQAPLQFAPFTQRLAALTALAAAYGLGVHLLYRRQARSVPAEHAFPAPATLLPVLLLMGLAFWLMPLFQLVMTADGVGGVRPGVPTMVIGGVGLLAALAGTYWLRDQPVERRQHWLVAVLAVAALLHLVAMIQFAFTRQAPDFWILYKAVRDWRQGAPLYNIAGIELNHFGHTFKVPPFYGMLFLPFTNTAGEVVVVWHRVFNLVLLVGTVLTWFWAYRVRPLSLLGVGLLLAYNMRPIADTIAFGQIDIALLALLVAALVALQRGRDGWAGAAIALGTLFKLYPAVLLAFFVVKGRWRALLGFAAAMVVLNGLAVAVMGWEVHRVYLFEVLPRIGGGTAWVENQTLNGFLSRLAGGEIASNVYRNPLVSLATYGGFLLALGVASLVALQPAERTSPRFMLQYGQFMILMVLFVPAAWMHYATITVVAFVAVLFEAHEQPLTRWRAALFGLAYALIAYGNQWSFYGGIVMGPLTLLGISYKFYGLLLLAAVVTGPLLAQRIRRKLARHEHAMSDEGASWSLSSTK